VHLKLIEQQVVVLRGSSGIGFETAWDRGVALAGVLEQEVACRGGPIFTSVSWSRVCADLGGLHVAVL
jgi:hypothetical protein